MTVGRQCWSQNIRCHYRVIEINSSVYHKTLELRKTPRYQDLGRAANKRLHYGGLTFNFRSQHLAQESPPSEDILYQSRPTILYIFLLWIPTDRLLREQRGRGRESLEGRHDPSTPGSRCAPALETPTAVVLGRLLLHRLVQDSNHLSIIHAWGSWLWRLKRMRSAPLQLLQVMGSRLRVGSRKDTQPTRLGWDCSAGTRRRLNSGKRQGEGSWYRLDTLMEAFQK